MVRSIVLFAVVCLAVLVSLPGDSCAQWIDNGIRVCLEEGSQSNNRIIPDGSGGAIVLWTGETVDSLGGTFVQKIDDDGYRLWGNNGINIGSGSSIVADGNGGAFLAWVDMRDFETSDQDIYAQRMDSDGNLLWTNGGVPVCTALESQSGPIFIVTDNAGGAIFVWFDTRNGSMDIYAQRLDGSGAISWTPADGIAVCTASGHQYPRDVVADGSGGIVIVWDDLRSGEYDIYAQRIDSGGSASWTPDGIAVCATLYGQVSPQIIRDTYGDYIIVWEDGRNSPIGSLWDLYTDIYGQRLDFLGNPQWVADGRPICTEASGQHNPRIISDEDEGAIISWEDQRNGLTDIFAERIDVNGASLWAIDGLPVTQAAATQKEHILIADGIGGAVIAWKDDRIDEYDVYTQKLGSDGSPLWVIDGIPVRTADHSAFDLHGIPDGVGGAIFAWDDPRDADFDVIPRRYRVYSQRVDAAGNTVIATLLQSWSARYQNGGVRMSWTLSESGNDLEFFILRSSDPGEPFELLQNDNIDRIDNSFSYTDQACKPGISYQYRVEYLDKENGGVLFETDPVTIPEATAMLMQNHPNPFNPLTEIRFYLPDKSEITLDVYDVRGSLIIRLEEGTRDEGMYVVSWNGHDRHDRQVSSGLYFYVLEAGKTRISKKMILLR